MQYYVGLDVFVEVVLTARMKRGWSCERAWSISDPEAISVYVRSRAPDAVRIGLETDRRPRGCGPSLKRLGLNDCIDAART